MNVLAINCGSSSLKFRVSETSGRAAGASVRQLVDGVIDHIGGEASLRLTGAPNEQVESAAVTDHDAAIRLVLGRLHDGGLLRQDEIAAAGHRVVHGGDHFLEPVVIDDQVMATIEAVSTLAPLHNAPALSAMRASREILGPDVPMVATFDTAFHRTMPAHAAGYAIPPEIAQRHGIRRYGFHGLAHRFMTERYAEIAGVPVERTRLITLQLGSGCSATAVDGGRSVDTSMGFTPLEGLMMATRSGDVDPSLAGFLARREGVHPEEVEHWLNTRSGLLGVSGSSRDMRELLEAAARGDARAALAVQMFCYRARKVIGGYLAALGGADAIIFGGGIGEHAAAVRERICAGMAWCGLTLDHERNDRVMGVEARISTDDSRLHAYVIPVDEALIITRDTVRCLRERRPG